MAKTYAEAGVDIDASDEATASLISKIKGTNRKGNGEPIELVNGFAGLVKLDDKALAVCTDGVGTKILLAEEMDSLHTVGIDCVAMNVNDLICVGAEPISFVDYVALNEPDNEIMGKLGEGLAEGCRQANCTLSGGETAGNLHRTLRSKTEWSPSSDTRAGTGSGGHGSGPLRRAAGQQRNRGPHQWCSKLRILR